MTLLERRRNAPLIEPAAETVVPITVLPVRHQPARAADLVGSEFLESLGVAVYVTDADGRIQLFNSAAAELWGRRPEPNELWCGSWRLYWPDGRPMAHDECPMAICLKEQREVRGYEAMAERPDGTIVWFEPYPSPLRDVDGRVIGAVNVLVDITARRRAEEQVRATADELRASNAIKDEFLGLVSHELRTPVTTIFGNARLLGERGARLGEEARQAMVDDIAGESERLLSIIENLLTLTRIEAGVQAELEPQVLSHLVRKSVDSFRGRQPGRQIDVSVDPTYIIVEADRAHLEIVFDNLLTNADKYSPHDEPIEVVVRASDGDAQVLVRDRGIGLPEGDPGQVFGAFYRSTAARERATGIGIGLTVCRRLAELQGGQMWARPRDGGGSEFGLALPLAPDPGAGA